MPTEPRRLKAVFSGTVQGVGFRAGAQRLAQDYAVTGTVRNLPSGKVELVAEGDEAELQRFLKAVRESHLSAYIRNVMTEWDRARNEFSGFRITR